MLKRSIRAENARERIFKHQDSQRAAARYKLSILRQSLEQNRKTMEAQTGTLSPAMQRYYHERLAHLADRIKSSHSSK